MNTKPLFSIVMPVYNTEKYLKDAIDSVLNQTFTNYELLLIDDCSTDGSPIICDEYLDCNKMVKAIHLPQNKGSSNARNVGIDEANGQYICFVDSDDTIDSNLIQNVADVMKDKTPNAVMFGFVEDYYDLQGKMCKSFNVTYENKKLESKEELRREIISIEKSTLFGYSSNKFYNLDYLKSIGIKFEDYLTARLIEDFEFNIHFFENAESLYITDFPGYHYNKRINNSLTGSFVEEYFRVHKRRVSEMLEQYKEWDMCSDNVKTILANIYVRYIFSALQRNCDLRSKMNSKERKEWLLELYKEDLFNELILYASPESRTAGILANLLRNRNVGTTLFVGKFIYFVKEKMPIVFAKVKQKK